MAMPPRPLRPLRPLLLGAALLGVASVAAALVSPPASAHTVEPIKVALLSVNDFHGEIADPTTVQFAGTIEKQRALHGENSTLVLSAGDILDVDEGSDQNPQSLHFVPAFGVLNALDVRASAVGNHEFHNWYGALRTTIPAAADFPLLSANILKHNVPQFSAYEIFDVAGLEVAVIGATTRDTVLDPRVTVCGLTFTDPVDAVNATAADLAALPDPPDITVAVFHEGAQQAGLNNDQTRVGTATSADVDVVFAGHVHERVMFHGPIPGEPGKTRPVIQAGEEGRSVSEVVLKIHPKTKDVLSYKMSHVDRLSDSSESLIATYPRAAQVDAIVQDALVNPPGTTDQAVSLC